MQLHKQMIMQRPTTGEITWPGESGQEICQDCWETETSRSWWRLVNAIQPQWPTCQQCTGRLPIVTDFGSIMPDCGKCNCSSDTTGA